MIMGGGAEGIAHAPAMPFTQFGMNDLDNAKNAAFMTLGDIGEICR
jgi:hypothetical protein